MLSSIITTTILTLLSASTILAAPLQMKENEKRDSGARMTYYETGVGLGACGNFNPDSAWTVALNSAQFGGSYPSPQCGKVITISYGGQTAQATIQDECPGCPYGGLDLSPSLFQHFTDLGTGVFYADWSYGSGAPAPAPAPQPTTTSQPPPPPTSTYVAPTTSWTPPPTTTWTPPPSPTSTWVAPTTSSWTPPPTTSSTWTPPSSTWTPPSSSSTPVPSSTASSTASSTPSSSPVQSSASSVVVSSQSNTILNNLFSTSTAATGTATASASATVSASASASATQSVAGSTQTTQAGGVRSSNLEMLSGVILNIGRLVVVSA